MRTTPTSALDRNSSVCSRLGLIPCSRIKSNRLLYLHADLNSPVLRPVNR